MVTKINGRLGRYYLLLIMWKVYNISLSLYFVLNIENVIDVQFYIRLGVYNDLIIRIEI